MCELIKNEVMPHGCLLTMLYIKFDAFLYKITVAGFIREVRLQNHILFSNCSNTQSPRPNVPTEY
jgi:hypothetical protein